MEDEKINIKVAQMMQLAHKLKIAPEKTIDEILLNRESYPWITDKEISSMREYKISQKNKSDKSQ